MNLCNMMHLHKMFYCSMNSINIFQTNQSTPVCIKWNIDRNRRNIAFFYFAGNHCCCLLVMNRNHIHNGSCKSTQIRQVIYIVFSFYIRKILIIMPPFTCKKKHVHVLFLCLFYNTINHLLISDEGNLAHK